MKSKKSAKPSTSTSGGKKTPSKKGKSAAGSKEKSTDRTASSSSTIDIQNASNSTQNKTLNDTETLLQPSLLNIQHKARDIPIFTDQFLEHNRKIDSELRSLRKSNSDYEQQNSVLEKHVENMENGIKRKTEEADELEIQNKRLEAYLDSLRNKLATAFASLSIPTEPQGANINNIEKYMTDLCVMETNNSNGHAVLNKAKDMLRKIDLS